MVRIEIPAQTKRIWQPLRHGWWTGHARYQGQILSIAMIDELLDQVSTGRELAALLRKWNGSFALVQHTEDGTFAAVDIARTIPLFWSAAPSGITITDHPVVPTELQHSKEDIPVLAQAEFTLGHTTLQPGLQQLQAGELLEINDGLCHVHTYFEHRRPLAFPDSDEVLENRFASLLEKQIDRLIDYADRREIVVPLSGGYDSRILLALLHQKQYPKLKAFTYGQPDSWEVNVAREVAKRLDVDWQFVHYSEALLKTFGDTAWWDYAAYAGKLTSVPQEQDYFALRQLRQDGWLTPDSVICPGYCGDFQAGSYLPVPGTPFPRRRTRALQDFLFHHFARFPNAVQRRRWEPHLPQVPINNRREYISELEHWVLREYVSKFIVNGVRAYEWFDCDWYLPLWDLEFIQFWQRVPERSRKQMNLYRSVMEKQWFDPLNITFAEDRVTSALLSTLAAYLPPRWKAELKHLRPAQPVKNVNGLHRLVPLIQQQLGWSRTDLTRSVNEMIGRWYHQYLN